MAVNKLTIHKNKLVPFDSVNSVDKSKNNDNKASKIDYKNEDKEEENDIIKQIYQNYTDFKPPGEPAVSHKDYFIARKKENHNKRKNTETPGEPQPNKKLRKEWINITS